MREVGVRELRANLPDFLAAVDRGEIVTITTHGRRRAQLIPANADNWAALIASNEVTAARIKPRDLLAQPPRTYPVTTAGVSQADQ